MSQENRTLAHPRGLGYQAPEKLTRIHALRAAGLQRDASQIPALLSVVQAPPDHFHLYAALHALGQIGDVSVVPAINAGMQGLADTETQNLAQVVCARLVAEAEAHKASPPQQRAQTWMQHFLQTLALDVPRLNAELKRQHSPGRPFSLHEDTTRETFVVREFADRIYRQRDAALLKSAQQAGIDFDIDAGAKYKVQIAQLSPQQRVEWLVNTLAAKEALTGDDLYLEQLAADEGKLTSKAVAAKLKDMDQHREKYANTTIAAGRSYFPGITAMFNLLRAIGDKEDAPLIAQYLTDKQEEIRYYAEQAYPEVMAGTPWKWRIAY